MVWLELSVDATQEAVDWVSTLLAKAGYAGEVQISPYGMLERSHPANHPPESDWVFTIRLYSSQNALTQAQIHEITNALSPLQRTGLTSDLRVAVVDQKRDRVDIPDALVRRIGQRFVVVSPEALYQPAADEVTIQLASSLAFGSGFHPATILSLKLIDRYVRPTMQVLDLGSGSGILSVAMAKLGATVLALDNDQVAVQATHDAVCRNGVESQVTVMEGSLGSGSNLGLWMGGDASENVAKICAEARFDLIAANILARMHIALANDFQTALRRTSDTTGLLITAGFTNDYESEVDAALIAAGFVAIAREQFNEWVALVHQVNQLD